MADLCCVASPTCTECSRFTVSARTVQNMQSSSAACQEASHSHGWAAEFVCVCRERVQAFLQFRKYLLGVRKMD